MNIRKFLLVSAAILGLAGQAFAQTPDQVTVARVTGTATAQLPDGSTVDVKAGDKLPQGATIKTGDNSEVYFVNHGDTTTTVVANSEVSIAEVSTTASGGSVTKQKTTLDLKSGNIVAKLNPAKKSVNDYSVRTPKGVAAARGTVFTVSYKGGTYSIAVVNGSVTIMPISGTTIMGNTGVQVNAGQAVLAVDMNASAPGGVTTLGGTNLITNLANNSQGQIGNDLRELLAVAVATVTIAAQNNIGGTTATDAAAVAQAVFAAVPAAAEQAGAIIAQSNAANPPADPARAATVLQEVTTATPPAAQGAFTSGATTGTFTPSTQNTATDAPGSNTGNQNRSENSPNQVTTPQPIDPSTVSRGSE